MMAGGAISYPRTYGRRRGKWWRRGKKVYLSIASRRIIIEYTEWTFKAITYVKRTASLRAALRRDFDAKQKADFLKRIAETERDALMAAGFTQLHIDAMAKGVQPRGYSVHHKLPLDDGGDNSHANLVLIRETHEHAALTAYQNSVTKGMRDGEAREVDFPVPERDIVVYPPTNDPPKTLPLWPLKDKR
ncbi:MAG: hypothetical protein ACYDA5_03970 [Vulcanimicrobiaceae bacterium]